LNQRCDSLLRNLDEQFQRSRQLKFQKPAPPVQALELPETPPKVQKEEKKHKQKAHASNQQKDDRTDEVLEAIKDKWFGGDIPDSLKKKIPKNVDPSVLDSDATKDMMKRLNNK